MKKSIHGRPFDVTRVATNTTWSNSMKCIYLTKDKHQKLPFDTYQAH